MERHSCLILNTVMLLCCVPTCWVRITCCKVVNPCPKVG